jgi:hypothetical protein
MARWRRGRRCLRQRERQSPKPLARQQGRRPRNVADRPARCLYRLNLQAQPGGTPQAALQLLSREASRRSRGRHAADQGNPLGDEGLGVLHVKAAWRRGPLCPGQGGAQLELGSCTHVWRVESRSREPGPSAIGSRVRHTRRAPSECGSTRREKEGNRRPEPHARHTGLYTASSDAGRCDSGGGVVCPSLSSALIAAPGLRIWQASQPRGRARERMVTGRPQSSDRRRWSSPRFVMPSVI